MRGDVGLRPSSAEHREGLLTILAFKDLQDADILGEVTTIIGFCPVLAEAAIESRNTAAAQDCSRLTSQELFSRGGGGCQSVILFDGTFLIHIAGKLEGGEHISGEVTRTIDAVFALDPLIVAAAAVRHGGGHAVSEEESVKLLSLQGSQALNLLAFGVSLDDGLNHFTEFIKGFRFLGDAGLLRQVPAICDNAVAGHPIVARIGLAGDAVELTVNLQRLNVSNIQIRFQIRVRAQVSGQTENNLVLNPRIIVRRADGVDGEDVRQGVSSCPSLNLLNIVIPCGVHRFETDAEFVFDILAHRIVFDQ